MLPGGIRLILSGQQPTAGIRAGGMRELASMAAIQNRMRNLRMLALLCGALAFLLFAVGASAQQPSPPPPPPADAPASEKPPGGIKPPMAKPTPAEDDEAGEIIRVTSNLIVVPVSVTDAAGQPVMGLTIPDFRLEEEGRAQEITQIGDPEQIPLDIAILLDVSGSVDARFTFEKEAAARFLKQVLKPGDRATLFAIDQKPRLEQARDTAERVADRLLAMAPAKGATAFYDTVNEASKYLVQNTPAQHRRVIVVISDGEDNFSNRTRDVEVEMYRALNDKSEQTDKQRREQLVKLRNAAQQQALLEVQRELQRAEVVFYSINPSGEALRLNPPGIRAQEGMARLAEATGGNTFVPESQNVKLSDLDKVFNQIASELRSQYLLQYYSNNDESPSAKFLRIKVEVPTRPQARIRARQGYYPKHK
jgi:VWFA-related protein